MLLWSNSTLVNDMRKKWVLSAALPLGVALSVVLVAGCEAGDINGGHGLGDGSPLIDGLAAGREGGAGDGHAGDVSSGRSCVPPCQAPRFCSKAGTCINKGTCLSDGDCSPDRKCDLATRRCVPRLPCGQEPLKVEVVAPNLLIVLDRSCSMRTRVKGIKLSKWRVAVDAIKTLTTAFKGKIRFGLTLFPDRTGKTCLQDGPVAVPMGASAGPVIRGVLSLALSNKNKFFPNGPCVTNIDTAMKQASQQTAFTDKTRGNFVLLITDGMQAGCGKAGGNKGTTAIISALAARKVYTFVVGFGSAVNPKQMNIFAKAGGVPTAGPTTWYYKAENQATLNAAFIKIARVVASCIYKLKKVPANLNKIYVYFDKREVKKDPTHKSGWDYNAAANQITFYGSVCKDLKDGKARKVDIVYGCKLQSQPDGGILFDGGAPRCKPGQTVCRDDKDCPWGYVCHKPCCEKVVS